MTQTQHCPAPLLSHITQERTKMLSQTSRAFTTSLFLAGLCGILCLATVIASAGVSPRLGKRAAEASKMQTAVLQMWVPGLALFVGLPLAWLNVIAWDASPNNKGAVIGKLASGITVVGFLALSYVSITH